MSEPLTAQVTDLRPSVTPSLPRRLLDTFVSPSRMGRAVAHDPKWIGALLVALALIALSSALLPTELFVEVQRRAALARGTTPPPMTDDPLRILRLFSIIGGPIAVGTIRFVVANKGAVLHEMVLGTPQALKEHADLMKKHPGMEHEEPNMAHVKPGATGDIVWQFTKAGDFQFACLIPGHFDAGMVGKVAVK